MLDIGPIRILDPEPRSPLLLSPDRPSGAVDETALLDAYSSAVTHVVDQVGPEVVRIEPRRGGRAAGMESGVIISPDGLVLTNSHVVQGGREMSLAVPDGPTVEAPVLGDDPATDLALLRVTASDGGPLPFARLGDSKALRRGQMAVAMGYTLSF